MWVELGHDRDHDVSRYCCWLYRGRVLCEMRDRKDIGVADSGKYFLKQFAVPMEEEVCMPSSLVAAVTIHETWHMTLQRRRVYSCLFSHFFHCWFRNLPYDGFYDIFLISGLDVGKTIFEGGDSNVV